MKELAFIQPAPVFIEFGLDWFRALRDNDGLEVPLERLNSGRLTDSCKEKLAAGLNDFLKRKKWQLPANAFCAIGASGVSLRRIALPQAAGEELPQLLRLQIESAFPLGPEELAWGCLPLNPSPSSEGASARQEFLAAAIKKEVIEEYSRFLSDCGLKPVFTLAALARKLVCPPASGSWAILNLERGHSEWIAFENDVPAAFRIFPWGSDRLAATTEAFDQAVNSIRASGPGQTLYLTGGGDRGQDMAAELARRLGGGVNCRSLDPGVATGHCAATLGLQKWVQENGGSPPLVLRVKPRPLEGRLKWSDPTLRKRAAAVALLLVVLLAMPYAQAILLKPFVTRKLAAFQSDQGRLSTIDQETGFLQFLKENQPPYLEALYLFAKTAPPGTRLDSVTMNRHGEVTLRGSLQGFQQVVEFRAKLIKSGFFSDVSVEEQVPESNQQKVNVRIVAQWKPVAERALLAIGPDADEIKQSKTSPPGSVPTQLPPGGGIPMGLPGTPSPNPLPH
ncbi:MAG TPA: hypothetical protein VFY06_02605 [Verrucomicrobiae bacterium]|nr:hypothetical protein [Verrucomicrobiae bacterium]